MTNAQLADRASVDLTMTHARQDARQNASGVGVNVWNQQHDQTRNRRRDKESAWHAELRLFSKGLRNKLIWMAVHQQIWREGAEFTQRKF